ncbi:Iguana/Dzip1-like DAZ-interacting protein N-terminal-domain-containing protein [Pavlovales sp. CCMP2436]|nr:Iguana/Dzip1-like DAZ-interacting protein N-terminal-domain-containing protein [Pavlovales sp. CCMP2436]
MEAGARNGMASQGGTAGAFQFQPRTQKLDWRRLVKLDVDAIARDGDIDALEACIENVTYAAVTAADLSYFSDEHFVSLFRTAQLLVEYLLHVQSQLFGRSTQLEEHLAHAEAEAVDLREALARRDAELKAARREQKRASRQLAAYELLLARGGGGLGPIGPGLPLVERGGQQRGAEGGHECSVCQKLFSSAEFCRAHVERRHPEAAAALARSGEPSAGGALAELELGSGDGAGRRAALLSQLSGVERVEAAVSQQDKSPSAMRDLEEVLSVRAELAYAQAHLRPAGTTSPSLTSPFLPI